MHKSRDTQNLFCTFVSQGNTGFVDYRFLNYYVTVFACFLFFFFSSAKYSFCLEKRAYTWNSELRGITTIFILTLLIYFRSFCRGMVDASGDQFVAYFLPTRDTIRKRKRDQESEKEFTEEEE